MSFKNVVWQKFFLKNWLFEKGKFFKTFLRCSPLEESNENNNFFWGQQNSKKKVFSPKHDFFLYHRSSVTPLITMSFQEVSHEKNFRGNYFFRKTKFFKLLSSFLCIPLIFYSEPPNIFCENGYSWKKTRQNNVFLFQHRYSVTPTENIVTQKNFHGKVFLIFCLPEK